MGTREGILGVCVCVRACACACVCRAGTHWYYAQVYLHHLEQLRRRAVVAPLREALHSE